MYYIKIMTHVKRSIFLLARMKKKPEKQKKKCINYISLVMVKLKAY